jgi:hypothetical protein
VDSVLKIFDGGLGFIITPSLEAGTFGGKEN